jgi:hypothetical protein
MYTENSRACVVWPTGECGAMRRCGMYLIFAWLITLVICGMPGYAAF